MQTHVLSEKEWRKAINQAFILKEHGALSQILKLKTCFFRGFFFHLPSSPLHSLGILCFRIKSHIERVQKSSIGLLSPLLQHWCSSPFAMSASVLLLTLVTNLLKASIFFLSFSTFNCCWIQVCFFFLTTNSGVHLSKTLVLVFWYCLASERCYFVLQRSSKKARNVTE